MSAEATTSTKRDVEWGKLLDTALTAPGQLGNAYSRFYEYSFLNCLNLLMQGVEPQPVATYKRWQEIGRQVIRGAKAKEIIRPITIEKKNDDGEVEGRYLRFKAVRCIFPLCDTDGPELPAAETRGWDLNQALKALDTKRVPFAEMNGNIMGYSYDRNFAVSEVAVDPLKTTVHELGHIVCGHTAKADMDGYRAHRGIAEFQAESTAYLTLNELNCLTDETASQSRAYIQTWLRHEQPTDVAIRQVFSATDKILRAGRMAVGAGMA